MGIFASDNVSHLANIAIEPRVEGHYDYDEYVITEYRVSDGVFIIAKSFGLGRDSWEMARREFLRLFVDEKLPVKLIGRVFN